MIPPSGWVPPGAALALLLGLLLIGAGRGMRRRRGLGGGNTLSLDRMTLTSRRMGLTGRPDRLVKAQGTIIVEELKSSHRAQPGHQAQLGVYFLLVEEHFGVRPTHGFIVTGDGARHRIENSDELRVWVLGMAAQIRAARESPWKPIAVRPYSAKCRPCGMRGHCGQARL